MYKTFSMAAFATTSLAYKPPTDAERASVKEWDDIMKSFGRDYEIHRTKTDDDWELTLFRIIPQADKAKSDDARIGNGRTVLFQHGLGMDARTWLSWAGMGQPEGSKEVPAFLTLADQGYDVWMGNNRGTPYSNVNPNYPYADDRAFGSLYTEQNFQKYDFSFYEMGTWDVPAMLDKITEESGNEKVTYVGYSQGTSQILYGLSTKEQDLKDKLEKVILLAPCLYIATTETAMQDYQEVYPVFRYENVNVVNTPYWEEDKKNICKAQPGDLLEDNRDPACLFATYMVGVEGPLKSFELYGQIGITGRFQDFVRDFSLKNQKADLVKPGLGSIKSVPVQLVQGTEDQSCNIPGTRRLQKEIGERADHYVEVQGANHEWFGFMSASPEFLDLITSEIEYVNSDPKDEGGWFWYLFTSIGSFLSWW